MNQNLNTGVPLIGAPKLSDSPPLPDEVIHAYLQPLEQAISQGASFAQPVTVELLVLATALRDLRDLRAAVDDLDPVYAGGTQALLPNQPESEQEQP